MKIKRRTHGKIVKDGKDLDGSINDTIGRLKRTYQTTLQKIFNRLRKNPAAWFRVRGSGVKGTAVLDGDAFKLP